MKKKKIYLQRNKILSKERKKVENPNSFISNI